MIYFQIFKTFGYKTVKNSEKQSDDYLSVYKTWTRINSNRPDNAVAPKNNMPNHLSIMHHRKNTGA